MEALVLILIELLVIGIVISAWNAEPKAWLKQFSEKDINPQKEIKAVQALFTELNSRLHNTGAKLALRGNAERIYTNTKDTAKKIRLGFYEAKRRRLFVNAKKNGLEYFFRATRIIHRKNQQKILLYAIKTIKRPSYRYRQPAPVGLSRKN